MKLSAWLQLQRGIKTLYAHPLIAATPLWRKLNPQARYVAITGSAGKTTTKDLLVTALGGGPHAIGNDNSNNQPYGIARTMLRVRPWTRIVVQEFGASEPGGIARMARQFSHGVAVVLNVGNDHRSAFGGEDGIALEKGVLVETLPADGLALLNADDARVMAMASRTKARVITFGLASGDVRGRLIAAPWPSGVVVEVTAGNESVVIRTGLIAEHFALNVVAAVATAWALGTKLQDIVPRLADSTTLLGRATLQHLPGGVVFVRDDWKAPAWTLDQSLRILDRAKGTGQRYLVLGTLSDYGGDSRRAYRRAIAAGLTVAETVMLIGERASVMQAFAASHPGRVVSFATVREAADALAACVRPGDVVLLKGSNKADHLARIALRIQGRDVRCWQERCGRIKFCDDCAFVGRSSA